VTAAGPGMGRDSRVGGARLEPARVPLLTDLTKTVACALSNRQRPEPLGAGERAYRDNRVAARAQDQRDRMACCLRSEGASDGWT
jgi:hypothetical protein